jgi:hypothetical protein
MLDAVGLGICIRLEWYVGRAVVLVMYCIRLAFD